MGGKTTSSTQSVQIPPEVMARYNAVNTRAEDVASRPFIPYSNDPNAFVAGLTPSQQAGIENINSAAGMSQPSYAAGQNMVLGGLSQGAPLVQQGYAQGQALTGNALDIGGRLGGQAESAINAGRGPVNAEQFSGEAVEKYMSPYMKNVIEAQQALQQQEAAQQRSALSGQAIMSGAFGGDRGGIAQANLARQQSMANQATLSGLLQQNYGQALNAFQQQQGVNLGAGQANRAATQNAANQLASLGQQQYAQQSGAGQNLYNMGTGAGQALYGMGTGAGQAYAGLGGQAEQAALNAGQAQMGAGQIQQQTDQAGKTAMYNQFLQQQGFPFQQAQFLANVAMGTGALSGQTTTTTQPGGWSDRRLKEDIRKVGKTYDGQDIYSYRFKGEKHTQIGLMAQDVEKHTPDAVGSSRGYKTLDYKKATDDAADRGHFAAGGLVPSSMGGAVFEPGNFARGGYVTGGMVPTSPDEDGNPRYVYSDDVSSSGYGTPASEVEAAAATKKAADSAQVANLYKTKLGRVGTQAEYDYWTGRMAQDGSSIGRISDMISASPEAKEWTKKAPGQMATGIADKPYQEALTYKPDAFSPRAPITRNESGFAAATPGSSYSSFAPPQYQPTATGKGTNSVPSLMGAGAASGKGPTPGPSMAPAQQQMPQWAQDQQRQTNALQAEYQPRIDSYNAEMTQKYGSQQAASAANNAERPAWMQELENKQQAISSQYMPQDIAYQQQQQAYQQQQQPQASGKGPTPGAPAPQRQQQQFMSQQQPQAYGKGPSSAPAPTSYPAPYSTPYSAPAPASASAPAARSAIPADLSTRAGRAISRAAPTSGMASGGRIERQAGGGIAALLQQLAAQHAQQYGQMPGGPGTEAQSRIKHTLQMPSAEAQRRLSPGSLPPKQQGGIQSGLNAGAQFANLYKSGKELKKDVTDFFKKEPEVPPEVKGASSTTVTKTTEPGAAPAGARADASVSQQADLQDQTSGAASRAFDIGEGNTGLAPQENDIASLASNYTPDEELDALSSFGGGGGDFFSAFAARGGRINRYAGGRTGYRAGGLPSGLAPEEGIEIPDDMPGYKLGEGLPKPGGGGGGGGGGAGGALSAVGTAVGVASAAAKILPFLFGLSDSRVKHHKEPIGELFDGQKVYRYDFGDGRTEIGLLAQEVEKRHPSAVSTMGGLKFVDYEKAVSRVKKQGGGGLGDILDLDEERRVDPEPMREEERGLNPKRIQLAALERAETMSDAEPIGLGAGTRTAALPSETGLVPRNRSETPRGDSTGSTPPAVVASATPETPPARPAPNASSERQPRSVRNNNPGNLEASPWTQKQPGFVKSDGRFAVFETPEDGYAAMDRLLQGYGDRGLDTVSAVINRWSPQSDPTNQAGSTSNYIRAVARAAGVGPDERIDMSDPEIRGKLTRAMASFEGGGQMPTAGGGDDKSPIDRATRIASNYTQGPVEKIGAKLGIPEMMRDERVFVPLLAGIGSMLASDKPRFSQALGEGLAGAAGAYGAVRGQTQEIANRQADERLTNVQAAGASILKDGTGRPYGVLVFDPKTGGMRQMDFGEAYRRREELNLLPETTERIRQLQMDSDSGAAVSPRPGTGSSTSSNTGTGTVSGAGATTGSTTSSRTEARPPAVDPEAVEPAGTPPRRPEGSGPVPVARIFAPNDSDITRINAESQKIIGQDVSRIPDYYTRAVEQSQSALDQRPLLFQFANAYSGLPDKGPMTPGAFAPVVRNVGEVTQSFFKNLGITGPLNQADIDRATTIDKLTAQMKAQASEATGQRSYSALQELGSLAPTIGTPKGGGAKNLAAIIVANQSKIDEDLFAKGLLDRADEANKTNARYTGQVIRELFTNRFSSKQEQERDSIAKMFSTNYTEGQKPVVDPSTGRPVNWMQWLSNPKNAESLSRQEQAQIEKNFGEGILRYFPGVRR